MSCVLYHQTARRELWYDEATMVELTRGELAMVVFIFLLVYGGLVLPRFGAKLGARLARGRGVPEPR
jgi:hypothetical protein